MHSENQQEVYDLLALGLEELAYFKPVRHQGGIAVAVHAADGTPMALATDTETAVHIILERRMLPAFIQ